MRARLLANLNWLIADKILRLAGGLLVGVWVARYLGPEQYGLYSYALAFVALFGAVAKLGIDQVVIREWVKAPEKEYSIFGSVLWLKLGAALLALMLVTPVAWLAEGGDWSFTILVTIVAVGLIFNVFDAYEIYYQAHILSRNVVLARSSAFVLFLVIRVILILGEYSVIYFAAAATLELALGGVNLAIIYKRKQGKWLEWHFDRRIVTSLLRDGWPLIVSTGLIVIHMRIDQVMIGQMLNNADVGIYSVAVRLSETWLFFPAIIVQTITPYMMKLREINMKHYQARLIQLYSIMFWLGIFAGVATIFFGDFFVRLLFGEAYRDAFIPLVLTIWTGVFISQGIARGIWMVGENMQGYRLMSNLIAVPMNIALNLWLIPKFGVTGASAASLISVGIGTWVVPFLFKSMRSSNRQLLYSIHPKYLFVRQ